MKDEGGWMKHSFQLPVYSFQPSRFA
jgi:hypothetical protein